jgi:hypothetical protein
VNEECLLSCVASKERDMIGVESSSENVSPSPNVNHIATILYTREKLLATELSVVLTKLTVRIHNASAYRVLHPGSLTSKHNHKWPLIFDKRLVPTVIRIPNSYGPV